MKSNFLSLTLLSLLAISFVSLPGASTQCLTGNDALSQPGNTDLSTILGFSLRLFQELAPKDEKTNFIFSPYSIWNALVLAYFGSAGQTEAQFQQVLGLGDKVSTMRTWRGLEFLYNNRSAAFDNTFIVANRIYFDKSVPVRECIDDLLHKEIEKIDFGQSSQAANTINRFVSETTRYTINDLFSPGDIQNAIVALVNAAYFKGAWEHVFDERITRKAEFTGLDNTKYSVDMMTQMGGFKYVYDESLDAEIVELPYVGKTTSMLIFLPSENKNFNRLADGLSASNFENILKKMSPTIINLSIPKFSLKFRSGNELITALKKMGLTDPFDPMKANFNAFTMPQRQISLDASVHQAFIEVNEKGTKAGAATGFTFNKSGGTLTLECNRPFLFAIRDSQTRNILFMGSFKSSDQIIGTPGLTKAQIPSIETFPNIGNNLNNGRPGQDQNNPNRETITIPKQDMQTIVSNHESNPVMGTNTIANQNSPTFGSNNENNFNRGIPNQNSPTFGNDNENNFNRGIPNQNSPTFGNNNENNFNRGIPNQNSPTFGSNNENNFNTVIPNKNSPTFGNDNENNFNRGIPNQNSPTFGNNNENNFNRGIPNPNSPAFDNNNENNFNRGIPNQNSPTFGNNNEKNFNRGISNPNSPTFGSNNENNFNRGIPNPNSPTFGNNNENNFNRGIPNQNSPTFGINNGNSFNRGIPNQNSPTFGNNNENNSNRGMHILQDQNSQSIGFNNNYSPTRINPARGTNTDLYLNSRRGI